MLRFFAMRLFSIFMIALFAPAAYSEITGIWENMSRFVEFSADARIRVVLKPFYGFVYEDALLASCPVTNELVLPDAGLYTLSVRYAGEKKDAPIPVARIGDSLFFRFYRKISVGTESEIEPTPVPATATETETATTTTSVTETISVPTIANATAPVTTVGMLDGFYQSSGNVDALLLYRAAEESEFFCYYFVADTYYRIRYWITDARFKDVQASFSSASGKAMSVPKFIHVADTLYTCITSTGKVLRNYETGSYTVTDGFISFKPNNIVFSGTAAAVRKPLRVTLSQDGTLLVLGEPYLVKSKIAGLDAEIKAHNALRRPLRKPIFGFMNLDFHWDEIERIRKGTTY